MSKPPLPPEYELETASDVFSIVRELARSSFFGGLFATSGPEQQGYFKAMEDAMRWLKQNEASQAETPKPEDSSPEWVN